MARVASLDSATVAETLARLTSALPDGQPGRVWIAFSGGVDSHVLLHALATSAATSAVPGLRAIHIDHDLQADSAAWDAHCRGICDALSVPYESHVVNATAAPGESPESAARNARYAVFSKLLEDGDCLLTAQHRDDQLETFLLQLLRGAGPKGLAAMPAVAPLGAGWLLRPLLEFDRVAIQAYAHEHGLRWLEDPSNADTRFDRNYLRHRVIPRLRERWPSAAQTVARSARLAAAAAKAIERQARADLDALLGSDQRSLPIEAAMALGNDRLRELLRLWMSDLAVPRQSETVIERVITELMPARADAEPMIPVGECTLRRHKGCVYCVPPLPEAAEWSLDWPDPDRPLALPAGLGHLVWDDAPAEPGLRVHPRRGGERYVGPEASRPRRALKDVLRESGLPPWLRAVLPLVSNADGEVIGVPGETPGLRWQASFLAEKTSGNQH